MIRSKNLRYVHQLLSTFRKLGIGKQPLLYTYGWGYNDYDPSN